MFPGFCIDLFVLTFSIANQRTVTKVVGLTAMVFHIHRLVPSAIEKSSGQLQYCGRAQREASGNEISALCVKTRLHSLEIRRPNPNLQACFPHLYVILPMTNTPGSSRV